MAVNRWKRCGWCISLRAHSVVVLGNHDLSLLAIGARSEEEQRKVNPDLLRIVLAEDRDLLLDWLRMQKLAHVDRELGWMMIHAGLAPKWTTQMAEKHAREVEQQLQGGGYRKLLRNMYGDQPGWSPGLSGYDRSRAIINLFTRMRYCTRAGASPPTTRARRVPRRRACIRGSKCRAGSSAISRSSVGIGPHSG